MANQTSSTEKDPAMTEYRVESHPLIDSTSNFIVKNWTFRVSELNFKHKNISLDSIENNPLARLD